VPVERIELPTFGLQNRCSTAELNRQLIDPQNPTSSLLPAAAGGRSGQGAVRYQSCGARATGRNSALTGARRILRFPPFAFRALGKAWPRESRAPGSKCVKADPTELRARGSWEAVPVGKLQASFVAGWRGRKRRPRGRLFRSCGVPCRRKAIDACSRRAGAFSCEADTGSSEEIASKHRTGAWVLAQ
jgi:hypothetical protein